MYQHSAERQRKSEMSSNVAPLLAVVSEKSLVFSRNIVSSTALYRTLKNYQYSTEGQKCHQNSNSTGNNSVEFSGIFSRKIIASTDFLPVLRPDAPAPVVVKNPSPILPVLRPDASGAVAKMSLPQSDSKLPQTRSRQI